MKAYKTSKDYSKLKSLLDNGAAIITISNNGILDWASRVNNFYYFRSATIPSGVTESDFIECCMSEKVEFIEPNND